MFYLHFVALVLHLMARPEHKRNAHVPALILAGFWGVIEFGEAPRGRVLYYDEDLTRRHNWDGTRDIGSPIDTSLTTWAPPITDWQYDPPPSYDGAIPIEEAFYEACGRAEDLTTLILSINMGSMIAPFLVRGVLTIDPPPFLGHYVPQTTFTLEPPGWLTKLPSGVVVITPIPAVLSRFLGIFREFILEVRPSLKTWWRGPIGTYLKSFVCFGLPILGLLRLGAHVCAGILNQMDWIKNT